MHKNKRIDGDTMKRITIFIFLLSFGLIANPWTACLLAQEELLEEEKAKTEKPAEKPPQILKETPKEELQEETLKEEENIKDKSVKELYFKEKYEDTLTYSFEVVWNAIKLSLESINCLVSQEKYSQTDQGLFKGSLKSDYCVFSQGKDSTFDVLKKYSIEVPYIRGGMWLTGRMQYKFNLTEREDNTIYLLLKGEVSGWEEFVTHEVHFWKSNGYFEAMMLKRIKANCEIVKNQKK
jgi:hypothetical protein